MYFCYFAIISPWKWACPFIWINLNPLYPRMLCVKFGWKWLSGSREEDFWISSMYFHYFVIISPWKRAGPFIWTNLNPLHPRILWAKFGWNWLRRSGEEAFLISSMYFHHFVIISLGKRGALYLNKIESPLPKDALCQVWLKLAYWFWRRRFFKFCQCIFAIS